MFKRIWDVISFPFSLFYLILSFPFKVMKIFSDDKKDKRKSARKNSSKKDSIFIDNNELVKVGKLLFPKQSMDFEKFLNSFINNNRSFLSKNKELLKDYDNFELEKLKAIEVIYIFGDSKHQMSTIDWKGEENENEIEDFLEMELKIKNDWINLNKLRSEVNEEKQRDGKFIIELLRMADKDLQLINKKLIFLDIGWDAYIYTVIDQDSFKIITSKFDTLFYGAEKL